MEFPNQEYGEGAIAYSMGSFRPRVEPVSLVSLRTGRQCFLLQYLTKQQTTLFSAHALQHTGSESLTRVRFLAHPHWKPEVLTSGLGNYCNSVVFSHTDRFMSTKTLIKIHITKRTAHLLGEFASTFHAARGDIKEKRTSE